VGAAVEVLPSGTGLVSSRTVAIGPPKGAHATLRRMAAAGVRTVAEQTRCYPGHRVLCTKQWMGDKGCVSKERMFEAPRHT